jgi:hypothetical protein
MKTTFWAVLGSTSYGAFLFLVYVGASHIAPIRDVLIRPDPARAEAAIQAEPTPMPGAGVPIDPSGPALRATFKHRRQLAAKVDKNDPYSGENLTAKIESARSSALEVDRHDPFDPSVLYPPVNMFAAPFDEASPFPESASAEPESRNDSPPWLKPRHAKASRHAHAPAPGVRSL